MAQNAVDHDIFEALYRLPSVPYYGLNLIY
jgi:hypothetical protein